VVYTIVRTLQNPINSDVLNKPAIQKSNLKITFDFIHAVRHFTTLATATTTATATASRL
jgi:hypothetical protein